MSSASLGLRYIGVQQKRDFPEDLEVNSNGISDETHARANSLLILYVSLKFIYVFSLDIILSIVD